MIKAVKQNLEQKAWVLRFSSHLVLASTILPLYSNSQLIASHIQIIVAKADCNSYTKKIAFILKHVCI